MCSAVSLTGEFNIYIYNIINNICELNMSRYKLRGLFIYFFFCYTLKVQCKREDMCLWWRGRKVHGGLLAPRVLWLFRSPRKLYATVL